MDIDRFFLRLLFEGQANNAKNKVNETSLLLGDLFKKKKRTRRFTTKLRTIRQMCVTFQLQFRGFAGKLTNRSKKERANFQDLRESQG